MDSIELDQLFPGCPKVADGLREMICLWEAGTRTVNHGEGSLQFVYKKDRHAFRVGTATGGREPEVVIYTGKNDPRRGSPLVKGASETDLQKLKDLGFNQERPGWRKPLTKSIPPDFYTEFVEHAIKIVR